MSRGAAKSERAPAARSSVPPLALTSTLPGGAPDTLTLCFEKRVLSVVDTLDGRAVDYELHLARIQVIARTRAKPLFYFRIRYVEDAARLDECDGPFEGARAALEAGQAHPITQSLRRAQRGR